MRGGAAGARQLRRQRRAGRGPACLSCACAPARPLLLAPSVDPDQDLIMSPATAPCQQDDHLALSPSCATRLWLPLKQFEVLPEDRSETAEFFALVETAFTILFAIEVACLFICAHRSATTPSPACASRHAHLAHHAKRRGGTRRPACTPLLSCCTHPPARLTDSRACLAVWVAPTATVPAAPAFDQHAGYVGATD